MLLQYSTTPFCFTLVDLLIQRDNSLGYTVAEMKRRCFPKDSQPSAFNRNHVVHPNLEVLRVLEMIHEDALSPRCPTTLLN